MGNRSKILRLITKCAEGMTDCYEMSAEHWERSFTEKGGRKSNCIPGLGVLLEGVTLISPLVVDINQHVFFKERKKALRSANNLLQKQHMLSEICICGALNGPL